MKTGDTTSFAPLPTGTKIAKLKFPTQTTARPIDSILMPMSTTLTQEAMLILIPVQSTSVWESKRARVPHMTFEETLLSLREIHAKEKVLRDIDK